MARRPPGTAAGLSSTFIALLFIFPLIAAAQQQQLLKDDHQRSTQEPVLLNSYTSSHATKSTHPRVETVHKLRRDESLIASNERAIATLAPAELNPAVRAPPAAAPAGPTGGLTSRLSARSLQDWEVENFVLLATVDGKIHAREKTTGREKWAFPKPEGVRPMVETIYHKHNFSKGGRILEDEYLFIVEPSQDGALYVFTPGAGMQKLGMTVKQLAEEWSPYASEEPPFVYTAEKRNTLYTLDASNGDVLKTFSSQGATIASDDTCRRARGLDVLDNDERGSRSTLLLGQTEYTIGVQERVNGEPVCTIRYREWTPNIRDRDLQKQYLTTMDQKYIYSRHDGSIFTIDHSLRRGFGSLKPENQGKYSSPVARIYDVARPSDADAKDTSLVVLPQPAGPAYVDEGLQNVFINCTETGSWYAMSETRYPAVTDGAMKAKYYDNSIGFGTRSSLPRSWELVGVHSLAEYGAERPTAFTISGPDELGADVEMTSSNPENIIDSRVLLESQSAASTLAIWLKYALLLLLPMFSVLFATYGPIKSPIVSSKTSEPVQSLQSQSPLPEAAVNTSDSLDITGNRKEVRFQLPSSGSPEEAEAGPTSEGNGVSPEIDLSLADAESRPTIAEDQQGASETPKSKKKAHRGQRGGRKRKNSKKNDVEDPENDPINQIAPGLKQLGADQPLQPDQTTIEGESMTDVTDTIKLHNLIVYNDRELGRGSGGTIVYEGKYGGRDVAVKRMLVQYYEYARQEVDTLQETDGHQNVIRYFCQEQDRHFLYIAVELCQASLWDLYQNGNLVDFLTEERLELVHQIDRDMPGALYQLADGLNHLHSARIIHRDIKPQNILIAYPKKNQKGGPRLVISDFGLCKTLPDNVSTLMGTMANAGTIGWKAPELISQPKSAETRQNSSATHRDLTSSLNGGISQGAKRASDIFSLGCVFFYVLTGGSHPFDDAEGFEQNREMNIKKDIKNFGQLAIGPDAEEPIHLIWSMLNPKPEERPTALQVMQHPFFWSAKKRLNFLCDVSDHWEREPRDPPSVHLDILESYGPQVMELAGGDFLSKLDRKFIDTLGKQRKYTGSRMLDLLRALRNKKNHYEDMPDEVKTRVGQLPEGYLNYWAQRFPKLVMACYDAVGACDLKAEPRFRHYFEGL